MLTSTAAADQSEPSLILVVHGGFKRLPDGRPLLHVSCVDQDAAKRAFPTEASRQAPFARRGLVVMGLPGGLSAAHLQPLWCRCTTDASTQLTQQHPAAWASAHPLRFMRVIRRHGGGREQHANVNCTPPELRLLRYLLARNAAALRVPRWGCRSSRSFFGRLWHLTYCSSPCPRPSCRCSYSATRPHLHILLCPAAAGSPRCWSCPLSGRPAS